MVGVPPFTASGPPRNGAEAAVGADLDRSMHLGPCTTEADIDHDSREFRKRVEVIP